MVNGDILTGREQEKERFMQIKEKTLSEINEKVKKLTATGKNFDKIAAGELVSVMQKIQLNFK